MCGFISINDYLENKWAFKKQNQNKKTKISINPKIEKYIKVFAR